MTALFPPLLIDGVCASEPIPRDPELRKNLAFYGAAIPTPESEDTQNREDSRASLRPKQRLQSTAKEWWQAQSRFESLRSPPSRKLSRDLQRKAHYHRSLRFVCERVYACGLSLLPFSFFFLIPLPLRSNLPPLRCLPSPLFLFSLLLKSP